MVKLTLKFENLKDKIPPSQRKRLYRNAKRTHKFIFLTQEDIDYENWYSSYEDVGLSFGEKFNLVRNYLLNLSEEYLDDPEFLDKMRKIFDELLDGMAKTRERVREERTLLES